ELNNSDIIELDEDSIIEDIDLNENNLENEFILAMNNFTKIINENETTQFKRVLIDFSNNIDNI
ncbi:13390_t:CDS:1, partial [Racocetra fulgida]